MDLTIDITEEFNKLVNCDLFLDGPYMKSILFIDEINISSNKYEFGLMNFGLNINDYIERAMHNYNKDFEMVLSSKDLYKSIMIFGKAKITITYAKGLDLMFTDESIYKKYFSTSYEIENNDKCFFCSGYSSFSKHYITAYIVAKSDTCAKLTFNSKEYVLYDRSKNDWEISKFQRKYTPTQTENGNKILIKMNDKKGMMFSDKYREILYKEML